MIGSSDNSGDVVVLALVCGTECSGFESCFMLWFFSLVEIFLSSRRMSVHNEIQYIICWCDCTCSSSVMERSSSNKTALPQCCNPTLQWLQSEWGSYVLYRALVQINECITIPSRKRAHGQCALHWAKIGGWADIEYRVLIIYAKERPGKLPTLPS